MEPDPLTDAPAAAPLCGRGIVTGAPAGYRPLVAAAQRISVEGCGVCTRVAERGLGVRVRVGGVRCCVAARWVPSKEDRSRGTHASSCAAPAASAVGAAGCPRERVGRVVSRGWDRRPTGGAVRLGSPSPPDAATLVPGAVWHVESWVLSGGDVKPARPVVIVQSPRHGVAVVIVWARTTDLTVSGVFTPARVLRRLTKDGVVAPRHQHAVDIARLREPTGEFLGVLPEPYLSQVIAMWEAS